MSGHSHFATIKRQKAANDAVKGNLFSKLARNIMIAAKGGADPDMNFKLRVEIDKARAASMPKENIDRAIAKATTEALKAQPLATITAPCRFTFLIDASPNAPANAPAPAAESSSP